MSDVRKHTDECLEEPKDQASDLPENGHEPEPNGDGGEGDPKPPEPPPGPPDTEG